MSSTVRQHRVVLAGLTIAIALAACTTSTPAPSGSGGPSPSGSPASGLPQTPAPSPSEAGGATLILRVTTEGGFIAPSASLAAIPEVSVYADGRIMTPSPADTVFPAPLLGTVSIRDAGPGGAQQIVAAIRAAGLDASSTGTGGGLPGDTGTTAFAVNVDGRTVTTRLVLTSGVPGLPGGLGGSQDPEAQAATSLLDRLEDPSETWGATAVASSVLQPAGYLVFAAPGPPPADGSTSEPAVAWPLAVPIASFGSPANPDRGITGLRQGAVLGADAATLGPVLADTTSQTAFISGGMLYTLYVRPLLPDEVPAQG